MGKSELILKLMADQRGVYYLGQQYSAPLQVREFLAEAARALDMPLLAELRTADWQPALRTVMEQWTRANPGRKLVLALDEFQWIAASSPNLLSELQHCWDRWWRDGGNVLLVLCGSYLGFMEREVPGSKSPLFGRRTAQIHLQPFGYREAARFHPRWSLEDQVRAYFLVGGLPHYLLCLDDSHSIDANIRERLLTEFAPLSHEPVFLLREELRESLRIMRRCMQWLPGAAPRHQSRPPPGCRSAVCTTTCSNRPASATCAAAIHWASRRPNPRRVRFEIDDPLLRF